MNVIAKIWRRWRLRKDLRIVLDGLKFFGDQPVRRVEEELRKAGRSEESIQAVIAGAHAARSGRITVEHLEAVVDASRREIARPGQPLREIPRQVTGR